MRGRWLCALSAALLIVGCAGKKPIVPPEKLWSEGEQAFGDEAYEYAVDRYKALLDQHPFDTRAEEAELKIALAYYYSRRYAEAISAFGDFERMHPTSAQLAQVEYYLGMSYLSQASTSDRDQQAHTNALTYFRNLVDRFPQSPWTERARLRMRECRESLAKHEADVARYYLGQGSIRAAESRLRGLLTEYPETEAAAEALYGFAQEYARRDEAEGATLALATLVRHHPEAPLGKEARERLGAEAAALDGQDPLPLLVNRIDQMRVEEDRQNVRPTVSAYPDIGGTRGAVY
jgi:outer membrane protein assembly factor BamD